VGRGHVVRRRIKWEKVKLGFFQFVSIFTIAVVWGGFPGGVGVESVDV
jgi:hypothetical protein